MPRAWLPSPAEVYTIQGNSHGKPCTIPFKYDNQWFHGCTSTGREDLYLRVILLGVMWYLLVLFAFLE